METASVVEETGSSVRNRKLSSNWQGDRKQRDVTQHGIAHGDEWRSGSEGIEHGVRSRGKIKNQWVQKEEEKTSKKQPAGESINMTLTCLKHQNYGRVKVTQSAG